MNRRFSNLSYAILPFILAFAPMDRVRGAATNAIPAFTITDLGLAYPQIWGCSEFTYPWVINNRSEVAGASSLWTRNLNIVDLSKAIGQPAFACAINDAGEIGGSLYDGNSSVREPFLFNPKASVVKLRILAGGDRSEVYALNEQGQAVGYSNTAPNSLDFHAVLWTRAGVQDLAPGNHNCRALDINNSGIVAGYCIPHAFIWTSGAGMQDLGTLPGGTTSVATAINDRGQVVGFSKDGDSVRAFLWTKKDGMQDLGAQWFPTSVNDLGHVVGHSAGSSNDESFSNDVATLFESDIGKIDLNTAVPRGSGFQLVCATSINRLDQIVVYAIGRSDLNMHLLLLNPVTAVTGK